MQQEARSKIVENVPSSEMQTKIEDYSKTTSYASAIALVRNKRKTDPSYLFTDEEFPPAESSISFTSKGKSQMPSGIVWKRTYQVVTEPFFMKEGYSRDDVVQGRMRNCYFLTCLAAVAERPKTIRMAVPKSQATYPDPEYTGVFRIRLWQFGTWYEIVIDDWLPCLEDKNNQFKLAFGHSSEKSEFWIALAEKAYAKLYGSYEAIDTGLTMEAFEDVTGGISVRYDFEDVDRKKLEKQMRKAVRSGNFVSLAIDGKGVYDQNSGLQGHHAYSVTLADKIKVGKERVSLFRVRNPWGLKAYEWKLEWSDRSEKWDQVSEQHKKDLDYPAGDGEWYMSFDDIMKYMSNATICTRGPDFNEDGESSKEEYFYSYIEGRWEAWINAGGPYLDRPLGYFLRNPQFWIRPAERIGKQSSVFISLMQRYTRPQKEGRFKFDIGYRLYEVGPWLEGYLVGYPRKVDISSYSQLSLVEACDECKPQRGVSLAFELKKEKSYLFLPFTGEEGQNEDFLIRIYSKKKISVVELH